MSQSVFFQCVIKCSFAKYTRLACLLSFAWLFCKNVSIFLEWKKLASQSINQASKVYSGQQPLMTFQGQKTFRVVTPQYKLKTKSKSKNGITVNFHIPVGFVEFVELHCCFSQHSNASSNTLLHILRSFDIFVYFALVPSHALGA